MPKAQNGGFGHVGERMRSAVFTKPALRELVRREDVRNPTIPEADIVAAVDEALQQALDPASVLPPFTTVPVKTKDCVYYPQLPTRLIHRRLSQYVQKRFRISPLSRDAIVQGVLESLTDSSPMWIVRRDLKSFYESVPTIDIQARLLSDTAMPSSVRRQLRLVLERHSGSGKGLPRGIGLASTLAELAMNDFDRAVRAYPGVYRYFRYSDDILVFLREPPNGLIKHMQQLASGMGMSFNTKKGKAADVEVAFDGKKATAKQLDFDYLGYNFSFTAFCEDKKAREVTVSISEVKIKRTYSRVINSLRDFRLSPNYTLLHDRLKYLSSNMLIGQRLTPEQKVFEVKTGIYYNYRLCGVYTASSPKNHPGRELKKLDGFYHSLLTSQQSEFFNSLNQNLSGQQIASLKRLSFWKGFEERFMVSFTKARLAEIQKAWKYAR